MATYTEKQIRTLINELLIVNAEPQICKEKEIEYSDFVMGTIDTYGPIPINKAVEFAIDRNVGNITTAGNALIVEYKSRGSDYGFAMWRMDSGFYLHKWYRIND